MLFEESLEESKGCDLKYERLEDLLARRPFLLSDIVLKQNPNDVNEWLKRVKIVPDSEKPLIYARAITEIDGLSALGKFSDLWKSFANYFEQKGDL